MGSTIVQPYKHMVCSIVHLCIQVYDEYNSTTMHTCIWWVYYNYTSLWWLCTIVQLYKYMVSTIVQQCIQIYGEYNTTTIQVYGEYNSTCVHIYMINTIVH